MFYVVCGTCDWAFGLRPVWSFFVFVFVYSCVCGYWTLGILDIRQVVYKLVRKRGSGIPYLGVFGGTPPSAEAEGISALPRGRRANPSRFSASAASGLRLISTLESRIRKEKKAKTRSSMRIPKARCQVLKEWRSCSSYGGPCKELAMHLH